MKRKGINRGLVAGNYAITFLRLNEQRISSFFPANLFSMKDTLIKASFLGLVLRIKAGKKRRVIDQIRGLNGTPTMPSGGV